MLSVQEVIDAYIGLAESLGRYNVETHTLIKRLPPVLCRELALELPAVLHRQDATAAIVGADEAQLKWYRSNEGELAICLQGMPSSLIEALPLEGLQPVADMAWRSALLAQALDELRELEPACFASIMQWTSLIVWLERKKPGVPPQIMTATTLPMLPHTTLLSDMVLKHLPPRNLLTFASIYAIREALFHESLHQELAATLLHRDILSLDYDAALALPVAIPWNKGAAWEPDRVLHAIYVYANIIPMRARECARHHTRSREYQWFDQAVADALQALAYLTAAVDEITGSFSSEGLELVEDVRELARITLDTHMMPDRDKLRARS